MYFHLSKVIGGNHTRLGEFKNYLLLYALTLKVELPRALLDTALESLDHGYLDVLSHYQSNFKKLDDPKWFRRLIERMDTYNRLLEIKDVPEQVLSSQQKTIEKSIDANLKPEPLLALRTDTLNSLHAQVFQWEIMRSHPDIAGEIVKLLEISSIHSGKSLGSSDAFGIHEAMDMENSGIYAKLIFDLIAQLKPGELPALLEFANPPEELVYLNRALETRKVLAIRNPQLHNIILQSLIESMDQHLSGETLNTSSLTHSHSLQLFITYNPTQDVFKNLVELLGIKDPLRNHLNWILKHIPKESPNRDLRRNLSFFVIALYEAQWIRNNYDDMVAAIQNVYEADFYPDEEEVELETQADLSMLQKMKNSENLDLFVRIVRDLDIRVEDPREKAAVVYAFFEVITLLLNLGKIIFDLDLSPMASRLKQWAAESKRKHFMDHAKLLEIKELLESQAFEFFIKDLPLSRAEQSRLRTQYAQPQSYLRRNHFLKQLMGYYSFQNETGKAAVEDFIKQLLKNKMPLKTIPNQEQPVSIGASQKTNTKLFLNVWHDIQVHLGIEDVDTVAHPGLKKILKEIGKQLRIGKKIPVQTLQDWKKALTALKLDQTYPGMREALVNIDQIESIQSPSGAKSSSARTLTLKITGDPQDILEAGSQPYPTCQRISDRTLHNTTGQPLLRAVHPDISLAQMIHPESGEIMGRAILEKVREDLKATDSDINLLMQIFDQATIEARDGILVERRYLVGSLDHPDFDPALLRLLAQNPQYQFVVFSDSIKSTEPIKEEVSTMVSLGELTAGIYRDTFRPNSRYRGVNLKKLRKIWETDPNYSPF